MFPSCLILNAKQLADATRFMESFPKLNEEDVDCPMTSQFSFTVYTSGIGDSIILHGPNNRKLYLDDGLEA